MLLTIATGLHHVWLVPARWCLLAVLMKEDSHQIWVVCMLFLHRVYTPFVVLVTPRLVMVLWCTYTAATLLWTTSPCTLVMGTFLSVGILGAVSCTQCICHLIKYTCDLFLCGQSVLWSALLEPKRWHKSISGTLKPSWDSPYWEATSLIPVTISVPLYHHLASCFAVPQQGTLYVTTEFGKLVVEPLEICVIQVSKKNQIENISCFMRCHKR